MEHRFVFGRMMPRKSSGQKSECLNACLSLNTCGMTDFPVNNYKNHLQKWRMQQNDGLNEWKSILENMMHIALPLAALLWGDIRF